MKVGGRFFQHLNAFVSSEDIAFIWIDCHHHINRPQKGGDAFDDVNVAIRHGVEMNRDK